VRENLPHSGELNVARPFKAGSGIAKHRVALATMEFGERQNIQSSLTRRGRAERRIPALKDRAKFNGRYAARISV
jgi:hypothetical protein